MSPASPNEPLWLFRDELTSHANDVLIRTIVSDDASQSMSVELVRAENHQLVRRCSYRLARLNAKVWTQLRDTLAGWQDEQRRLRIEIGGAAEVLGDPTCPTEVVTIPRDPSYTQPE